MMQPTVLTDTDGENDGEGSVDHGVSDHTLSMRRAARYCLSILSDPDVRRLVLELDVSTIRESFLNDSDDDYQNVDQRRRRRKEVYDEFWRENNSSNSKPIPELNGSDVVSPRDFQRRFHRDNIPCLINFHETSSKANYFDYINQHWRTKTTPLQTSVNRDWFLDTLGADILVPVRFQPDHDSATPLDEDGRATECIIKSLTLSEWVERLKCAEKANAVVTVEPMSQDDPSLPYLKDWHLQLQLQSSSSSSTPRPMDIYECPPIFEYDLLNHFQRRFTKGDYRFCYWGPKGSSTSRHSDVLHSFSWSYNVTGSKQWTFFRETDACGQQQQEEETTIVVIQTAGQAMFVPSRWQHQVINLEETLSVNHNWITAANIDLCWDCLQAEMTAIDCELEAWGIRDNPEAEESMLRGCVGLDVTAFFLMVMVRVSDLLVAWHDEGAVEEFLYLEETLRLVLKEQRQIDIEHRLFAVLQSKALVSELLKATNEIFS
jgi:JmjC domain, hydroxylase